MLKKGKYYWRMGLNEGEKLKLENLRRLKMRTFSENLCLCNVFSKWKRKIWY